MFRKFLIYTGVFLVLLAATAALWVYYHSDALKQQAVTQLNERLQAPVNIEEIDLTFQQWPHLAVAFNEVYAPGNLGSAPRDTFLYFRSVQVTFDWWQALFQKFTVQSIYALQGKINLHENGEQSNYLLLKPNEDTTGKDASLREIILKNTAFTLHQNQEKILKTHLEKARIEGDFFDDLRLDNAWNLRGLTIYRKGKTYNLKRNLSLKTTVESKPLHLNIKQGRLTLSDKVEANFSLEKIKNATSLEFTLKKQALTPVKDLLEAVSLPVELPMLDEATGTMNLSGRYYTLGDDYNMEAALNIPNLRWSAKTNKVLRSGFLQAQFNSGIKGDKVSIDSIYVQSTNAFLQGHGSITNFNATPKLAIKLNSTLSLSEWLTLAENKTAKNSDAKLTTRVRIRQQFASLKDIQLKNISQRHLRGFLQIDEGHISMGDGLGKLQNINGRLLFESENLTIERLYAKKGASDFYLTGRLQNFLPYLFKPNQSLKANGKFISQNINLADFLTQETQTSETDFLRYFSQLNLQLELQVDALKFKNFKAQTIGGNLRAYNNNISVTNATMKLADGQLNGNLSLQTQSDSIALNSNFKAQNMALPRLFAAFDNFGQTTLYGKHLRGKITVNTALSLKLSQDFQVDLSSLKAKSQYRISNGRLTQFEPMLALSRFAQMEELRDVRFAELSSSLKIGDEQIHFAPTSINTNVLDFVGTGTHHFNNTIDYGVRLRLQEVLSKKEKKSKLSPELAQHIYEQESEDVPYLFLRLTGNALNPKVSIDKEAWLSSIGEDLQEQKKEWRKKLNKEKKPADKDSGIQFEWDGF